MGKPILYYFPMSPPVRSVLFVAKAINVELELKHVDFLKQEHLGPEYMKINPQCTIPTLDDNGHIIWDCQAICIYLIEKYANSNAIYPKDLATRSLINQRLFFNGATLFATLRRTVYDLRLEGHTTLTEKHIKSIESAYELFNVLFTTNTFLVGDQVTVADYACIPSITQMNGLYPFDEGRYPNIRPWIARMEKVIPDYDEANTKMIVRFKEWIAEILATNAKK